MSQILTPSEDKAIIAIHQNQFSTPIGPERKEVTAYNISIIIGATVLDLYGAINLPITPTEFAIGMLIDNKTHEIPLPKGIVNNIGTFLIQDKNKPNHAHDCVTFAYHINNMPYKDGNYKVNLHWRYEGVIDPDRIPPGSTIIICSHEKGKMKPTHFAVHLSYGLYISKFGSENNNVFFTTLKALNTFYKGTHIFIATPNI